MTTAPLFFQNHKIVSCLYAGSKSIVYQAKQLSDGQSVVLKVLRSQYPSFSEILQFCNQYTITKNLKISGIIRPYHLETWEKSYALVMEDFGGISLRQYIKDHSLSLVEKLNIALQLAVILHELHQNRIIHKDIKPANILIHPDSQQLKLIDFSIASLLPKETQEIQNPNTLEGTLAYLAPEQTGRMNRGIDYRADYYGLGVTLYELLTGELPFQSDDPLELVHCHMTKPAVLPHHMNSAIPPMVSAVILKLMAKTAEDRYQSGLGLKSDLEQCLSQWQALGRIAPFQLGQRDVSDRFLIPEQLYGREAEVQQLLQAFDRVATPPQSPLKKESKGDKGGKSEMMLVAGFSGIGKTAVVNEVHKPITQQQGYFIKGKFDQFNRSIPLSGFVQGLRDLMGQLLSETDSDLACWKQKILNALGENGQVIIDVIPELEQIIGSQPPVTELSGTAAQNRFNSLFQKFIAVFTTTEHPLVMFLDDLQWADSASLQLIKLLMADQGHLLLLGAYRDNEVSPAHPFLLSVEELKKMGARVNTITLKPLSQTHINQIVADTLRCQGEVAQTLTEFVYQKTQGNPFFTTQFLKGLHQEGCITFDYHTGAWQCDMTQVRSLSLTDDVVEFMATQLQKLPRETQTVLKLAACIGAQFDLTTLATISQQSQSETAVALWAALQNGLILPITDTYKFFQVETPQTPQTDITVPYKFLHDRVQQAAYGLIPDDQKQTTHYHIGQLLLQQIAPQTREEQIFELVGQLNYGIDLLTEPSQREELAQLNLIACRKARTATAYEAGRQYARMGLFLLGEQAWQNQYDMSLAFHELAAELALLCGDFEAMEQSIETVIAQARSLLELVKVYRIRIQFQYTQTRLTEAITVALQFLQQFGVTFPATPTFDQIQQAVKEVEQLMGDRPIEDLINLPQMVDPEKIALIQIANSIIPAAYLSGSPLQPLLVIFSVKLSIQYGNSEVSAFAYVVYSYITCHILQNIPAGKKWGQLALQVIAKLNAKAAKPDVCLILGLSVLHRHSHTRETLPILKEGYTTALELGNSETTGGNAHAFCFNSFWSGQPLAILEQETRNYCHELIRLNQLHTANYCRIYWQPLLNLLSPTEQPTVLSGEALEEAEIIPQLQAAHDLYGLYILYFYKLVLGYLLGELELAKNYAVEVKRYFLAGMGLVSEPAFYLYESLMLLAPLNPHCDRVSEVLQQVEDNQTQLRQNWVHHAPMNHQHKLDLVEAEKCRVLGQKSEAIELYDQAISGAKVNQYIQEEALANELAAKFYLNWGKARIAQDYLIEAYYCYSRWGAKAKVDQLEKQYPELLASVIQQPAFNSDPFQTHSEIGHSVSQTITSSSSYLCGLLDFSSVIKSFQALSSEMELEKLFTKLMQVILENAGATKGVLLFNRSKQLTVEVVATQSLELKDNLNITSQSLALETSVEVPRKLINQVKRQLKPLVIDDIQNQPRWAADDYLLTQQPASLLCLPILNHGKLLAILYLENRLMSRAFTDERVEVLKLLCSQAAISLENAELYRKSQNYAQQLKQSLEQLQASETRFQKLANNIPGVIYQIRVDAEGSASTPYISSGCQTLYEVGAEEIMIGKYNPRDFEHPEDQAKIYQTMVKSAQTLTSFEQEWRIITPNGNVKWVKAASQPDLLETGEIVWDGVLLDITERKRIEAEQQRLLAILENTVDFVGTADPNGQTLYLNQAWRNLRGLEDDTPSTTTDIPTAHPAWAFEIVANQGLPEATHSGMWVGETAVLDYQGREIPVSQMILAHKSSNGEVEYFSTILRDISKIKAAEAAVIQKSQELEKSLIQLQETQVQLVQSEKMSALGQMMSGITHEINNPLGFISGNLNQIEETLKDLLSYLERYQQYHPPGEEVTAYGEEIELEYLLEDLPAIVTAMKTGVNRIREISQSMRIFSRADQEKTVEFNLHQGLESTLLILRHRLKASEKRPEIQVIKDYGDLPKIKGFPGQLNQVFMNILANAIDMFDEISERQSLAEIKKNPYQIMLKTELAPHGKAVNIQIQDNGLGMPEEVKSKVFEHLFTTKAVGKGTGLGLSIARQIVVDKHRGTLECDSTVGQGTKFVIQLPISPSG